MVDAYDIVRSSALDCFWLCDGSLKEYNVPHVWQNPRRIYFGSAAVNVGNGRQCARGGSIALHNQYSFQIQEAELMSIYCALSAATEVPQENLIVVTDDNSKQHDIHCQVVKRWTVQEMNDSVNEFRCAIIGCIRMLMWELFTRKGVQSILFVNTTSLDEIRPEIIQRRHDPTRHDQRRHGQRQPEWEPHWKCAEMRQRCFEEGIENNMFRIGAPHIWDYKKVLAETSVWSSNLDWQWFSFRIRVSGCIFRLKDA